MQTNAHTSRLVIVGNGMATGRLLDELARYSATFDITVISDEVHGSYNRIMLSPVLAGELPAAEIIQKSPAWYDHNRVQLIAGARATQIDRAKQQVTTDSGTQIDYDHLILATGSQPARIPARNQALTNIFSFRTLDDVQAIDSTAQAAKNAVVIGGGLLGLEAAYGLACKGIHVTLVHRSHWLLNRQLDEMAGTYLRKLLEDKGIHFELGCEVDTFNGEGRVTSATLSNGEQLPCELAIIATGITPNQQLGVNAGLLCAKAIVVDEHMTTSDPAISALGECCEHDGNTFGLVEPIWHQCKSLAAKLAGGKATAFTTQPVATKLKVSGVQLFSAGDYLTTPAHRELAFNSPELGVYRKLLLKNNRIVGIVLFGDTRDGQDYFDLMQNQTDVSPAVSTLLLGKAFYGSQLQNTHTESTQTMATA